jgi:hypothetical protein
MDSNQDVDTRIAQLELELAEFRVERPKATRVGPEPILPRRRPSAWLLAASLFAVSLPVATWLHAESRGEQTNRLHSRALRAEAKLDLAARRHDVATRFLDAALDPGRSHDDRQAALRYLAHELGPQSKIRRWAAQELARTDGDAGGCAKRKAAKAKALREALEREKAEQIAAARSCGQ